MDVQPVDEVDDPRVDDYRSLTDVGLSRRREPEQGLFMAESHQVIARAVVAGYPVRSVLTTPRWQSALQDLFDDDAVGAGLRDTPVFPSIVTAGIPFSVEIEYADIHGNVDRNVGGDVVTATRSDSGSTGISGNTSAAAVNTFWSFVRRFLA